MKRLKKLGKDLKEWLAVVGCLVIGGWLRFYRLGANSLWKDEIFSLINASRPLSSIFFEKLPSGDLAPIQYIFIRLALFFGKSEFILRLPSVIFGIFSIILIYELGKLILNSKKVGLVSAFLLAISPLHLEYSREVRHYSLVIFFSSLTLLFFYKMILEKRWRWLILFCLTTVLNIATHPTALLVLNSQLLFLSLWGGWVVLKRRRETHLKIDFGKLLPGRNFIPKLILIASLIVVASVLVKSCDRFFKTIRFNPAMPFSEFLVYVLESLSGSRFLLIVYLAFFFLGLGVFFREKKKELVLFLLLLILPPLILYFVRPGGFGFHIRYVSFIVVPYLLLVSYGIVRLLKRNTAILVVAFILALLSIQPIRAYYSAKKGDWRGVGQYLVKNAKPGDVVTTESYYNKILLDYYLEAQKRGIILKTAAESLIPQKTPFRIYFHQHDYVTRPERLSNLEEVPLIDYDGIVSFDPEAEISPMYLFVSRPVWVWQEAEDEPVVSDGWEISEHYGRLTRGSDYLENPEAKISFLIMVPKTGNYDLYANLRWDGIRSLLKFRIDNRRWSSGFRPLLGEPGPAGGFHWKEKRLGSYYLTEGEHIVSFLNFSTGGEWERYQTIDYFYLTLNE